MSCTSPATPGCRPGWWTTTAEEAWSGPPRYRLSQRLQRLTTPVSFIAVVPADPFIDPTGGWVGADVDTFDYWDAGSGKLRWPNSPPDDWLIFGRQWRLASAGPDLVQLYGAISWGDTRPNLYDGTNGTKSDGDILRLQGGGEHAGIMATWWN